LQRDRPDLAACVLAGEISANAAAVEAGFRRRARRKRRGSLAAVEALIG
jgi:hypothetical protein